MTKKMKKQLMKLLNIHGVSGQEDSVREYLKPILETYGLDTHVDTYGNLLATKKIGNGEGATVLLSAHMDTVTGVFKNRKVLENNGVITSDQGALGADDRAGIAIILEVLRQCEKLSFEGTIKVAFSRQEEIGCVGASHIDKAFYSDVDLAIVVDRRGNRDIVVGNFYMPFCSNEVGEFMENVSAMLDMNWQCVEGGISDAMTFAEEGINSINVSAGYENEHTAKEYVVFEDMKDTVRLILQTLAIINGFYGTFGDIPTGGNNWVGSSYSYNYSSQSSSSIKNDSKYYENLFEDYIYADAGDVFLYEMGRDIAITQGENEIILSRENLKSLFEQVKHVL
jgi:putative aminopeptidase FrvX